MSAIGGHPPMDNGIRAPMQAATTTTILSMPPAARSEAIGQAKRTN
jgi:hypothetical protein